MRGLDSEGSTGRSRCQWGVESEMGNGDCNANGSTLSSWYTPESGSKKAWRLVLDTMQGLM